MRHGGEETEVSFITLIPDIDAVAKRQMMNKIEKGKGRNQRGGVILTLPTLP